jgi:hypothetical protein
VSLAEKWNEYRANEVQALDRKANVTSFWEARLREAFYAGAEAALDAEDTVDINALYTEIEHFKARPK